MQYNSTFPSWARTGLLASGFFNLLLALLHVLGLVWADDMFRFTGIEEVMLGLARIDPSIPYVVTVIVAGFFLLFGLIILSAAGRLWRFFRSPEVALAIGLIYIMRGLSGFGAVLAGLSSAGIGLESLFSLIALAVGLLTVACAWMAIRHRRPLNYDSEWDA
jgi:ABC-type transport system involved in multi-copper enzyme maturation permease subunit